MAETKTAKTFNTLDEILKHVSVSGIDRSDTEFVTRAQDLISKHSYSDLVDRMLGAQRSELWFLFSSVMGAQDCWNLIETATRREFHQELEEAHKEAREYKQSFESSQRDLEAEQKRVVEWQDNARGWQQDLHVMANKADAQAEEIVRLKVKLADLFLAREA